MRQNDLTIPSLDSPLDSRKPICREGDSLWILPWAPIFLVMIDETPDLASAFIRAAATLLVVLVVAFGRSRQGRSVIPRGRRWSRRCLFECVIWLVSGGVVLALISKPPSLWVDAATIVLSILAYGLLWDASPSGKGRVAP